MKQLNSKLFKDNLYEITNIHTGDMVEIVLADNEENALGESANENLSACSFFENGDRTMQDLEQELKQGGFELKEVLKTTEDLFYDIFDSEDYEIKLAHNSIHSGTIHSQQYMIVDKVQGVEIVFDVDYDRYDIFYVSANGIFFANRTSAKQWFDFLELLNEMHFFLHEWNYGKDSDYE